MERVNFMIEEDLLDRVRAVVEAQFEQAETLEEQRDATVSAYIRRALRRALEEDE